MGESILITRAKRYEDLVEKWHKLNGFDYNGSKSLIKYKELLRDREGCIEEIKQSLLRCAELLEKIERSGGSG